MTRKATHAMHAPLGLHPTDENWLILREMQYSESDLEISAPFPSPSPEAELFFVTTSRNHVPMIEFSFDSLMNSVHGVAAALAVEPSFNKAF